MDWLDLPYVGGTCLQTAQSHDDFYADVNSRNGDGFPHSVKTMAVSNGTFKWPDYQIGDVLGAASYLGFGWACEGDLCSGATYLEALIVEPRPSYQSNLERLPGDTFEISGLTEVAERAMAPPKIIKFVRIAGLIDFTFVPTESALACEGVEPGVDCTRGMRATLSALRSSL